MRLRLAGASLPHQISVIPLEAASYRFRTDDTAVRLELETPVERKVRCELPVRQAIQAVRLNGQPVAYRIETNAYPRLRVRLSGTANARFFIQLAGPLRATVLGRTAM